MSSRFVGSLIVHAVESKATEDHSTHVQLIFMERITTNLSSLHLVDLVLGGKITWRIKFSENYNF